MVGLETEIIRVILRIMAGICFLPLAFAIVVEVLAVCFLFVMSLFTGFLVIAFFPWGDSVGDMVKAILTRKSTWIMALAGIILLVASFNI